MLAPLGLLLCLGCTPAAAPAGEPVDVALVIAVDVSRSMDPEEFSLQRAGYVAAIRHPDFVAAVEAGLNGRIAIAYFEWAGTVRMESLVEWTVIDGAASAESLASEIAARPFGGFRGTSISGAVTFAQGLIDESGFRAYRRVIDISGDGPNNIGVPVETARDAAVAGGIVINGLPILIRPSPSVPHLDRYYAECVIGGPGSFVLPIHAADQFATAIRRKLILEVSGTVPGARAMPIADEPVDCMKGERDRQRFSDPYFPELDR
jgi:hypothetical protein